jgi:hypothetical protein
MSFFCAKNWYGIFHPYQKVYTQNFAPLIKLYREVWDKLGHDKAKQKVSAHSWGWLAEDQTKAERDYFYPTKVLIDTISQERPH